MERILKLEELLLAGLAFYLFLTLDYAWWWFLVFFLAPDLSMLGYVAGPKVGAWSYNLAHHKGVAAALFILGAVTALPGLQAAGLILLGHASLDRVFGYGLKYADSFQNTHLGRVGRVVR